MRVPRRPPSIGFVVQPTNRSLHGFETQTKKLSRWFWGPNHQTRAAGFEAETGKPSTTLVLRLNQETDHRFWGQIGRTIITSFEAKLEKTVAAGFEAKPPKTVATSFEAKPVKTVWVVLRPNHSQTVDLGFKAQPRNSRS
jgi:hypothetical protein